jgi:cytochrome c peroxidase
VLAAWLGLVFFTGGLTVPLGLDSYIPAPADNPIEPRAVALGRDLFFDKLLSRDQTVACATCHEPTRAFTDGKPIAIGVRGQLAGRRSPVIVNRAWGSSFFWDGRAATLEQQVLQPIANPKEMDLTLEELVQRLAAHAEYPRRFREIYAQPVSTAVISRALASYVRTILAGGSAYDRYVAGDRSALSEEAQLGLKLFRTKAGCIACHVGPNFTDERFHNTGISWVNGRWSDMGRAAISKDDADRGAFKTPTLRQTAQAAPYMHDGSLATLADVVDFYDKGGRDNPALDPEMRPLNLTQAERKALAAFLEALTGEVREGWPR